MSNDYKYKYFYDVIRDAAERKPDKVSFRKRAKDGSMPGRTFLEMKTMVDEVTAGLIGEGLNLGDRVAFLCDSSNNWFVVDCAIVTAGGVSTPRGTDVTDDDIIYILTHSEARFAVVQQEKDRERLEGLRSKMPALEKIFVMEGPYCAVLEGKNTLGQLVQDGRAALEKDPDIVQKRLAQTSPEGLATLIYTSGTTGSPKGVMLHQSGWLTACIIGARRIGYVESDKSASLLPPWHAFERAVEYATVMECMDLLITDTNNLRDDLRDFQPTVFPSVPRIWEMVYNGIIGKIKKESSFKQGLFNFFLSVGNNWARAMSMFKAYEPVVEKPSVITRGLRGLMGLFLLWWLLPFKLLSTVIFKSIHNALGGKIRISVSGGSALPGAVDKFLTAIGVSVVEGYGMTETSALISIRLRNKPTSGTVGFPLDGYTLKIKDEKGNDVSGTPGAKGSLWVKSDQLLTGYYKRPELNEVCFDDDGYFDTGDIMALNYRGELMFAGRAKDTIALAGGENIEPVPIEDRLLTSTYIDQVIVVGDDKKSLGALIVPNFDSVRDALENIPENPADWNTSKEVQGLYRKEIVSLVSKENGFKSFETIPARCFHVLPQAFDLDQEMTRTLKMKRPVIKENYAKQIDSMYN